MAHLSLVGHWKALETKTNEELKHAWVSPGLSSETPRNVPNLVFVFTKVSGCDLWPTVNSPRGASASRNDWISAPGLTQLKTNTHTLKLVTSDTLRRRHPGYAGRLLSISHRPRSGRRTCAAPHQTGSSDFSRLYSFTLIIRGINILCSDGEATWGRIKKPRLICLFCWF